jgi:hypothetical protein
MNSHAELTIYNSSHGLALATRKASREEQSKGENKYINLDMISSKGIFTNKIGT